MASVTVVEVAGDDDDEWGDEEEVVVWSNDLNGTHGNNNNNDAADRLGDRTSLSTHDAEVGEDETRGRGEDGHPRGLLIASLANLAISYNVVNIGLALKIMAQIYPSESTVDESLVSAGAIFGMMAGQIIFGAAGDILGRQFALCCTLLVCVVGATGSAFLTFDHGIGGADIFKQLVYWRVLLGVGAGGVYPLAAILARASNVDCCARATLGGEGRGEGGHGGYTDTGSTAVALMFSMQGVGYLSAHVTGYAILSITPGSSPVAWRLLLGLGAVLPLGLVVTLALAFSRARRYGLVQSALDGEGGDVEDVGGREQGGNGRGGRRGGGGGGGGGDRDRSPSNPLRMWLALRNKRRLLSKLVGTAGSWFLFDVTFYGNQLYEEDVLQVVLGGAESPKEAAFQDSIVAMVALPGYFVAAALIGRMGPRRMQVQGFFAMALLFAAIGFAFRPLHRHAGLLMSLYSLTFFFSNFGPNSTTFMLPSLTFPDQVRGSLNGISAAAGKLGALLGGLMFEPAVKSWGVGVVLVVCAMFSFAGGALTLAFVDSEDDGPLLVDAEHVDDSADLQEIELSSIVSGRRSVNGLDHRGRVNGNGIALGLSPRLSREHTPRRTKRKGMATYSSVGATANGNGEGGGGIGEEPGRGQEGVLGIGGDGYRSVAFGRTGEVEGQIETGGGGGRWDDSSDSGSEAGGGGDLVEPSAPRTSVL